MMMMTTMMMMMSKGSDGDGLDYREKKKERLHYLTMSKL